MSRFASFETHRFELGLGEHGPEWVELRDELSAWERDQMHAGMMTAGIDLATMGQSTTLNLGAYRWVILDVYVAGWQMFDANGALVPFSAAAVRRLDAATVKQIVTHIDAHQAEVADEKKASGGETGPTPISESPGTWAGPGPKSKQRQPASLTG